MIDFLQSYSIRDFMLFSRESYVSMLTAYNEWLWPWQFVFVLGSVLILYFVWRGSVRPVLVIAGLAWLWTGVVFHGQHFVEINWAAKYFAWVFVAQGVGLLIAAALGRLRFREAKSWWFRVGVLVFAVAAFVPWWGHSLFGWGAELTAVGTFGLLVAMRGLRVRLLLAPVMYMAIASIIEIG